ncbi:tRNA-dihydrouridine(20) synthase [NAD(P)+]-like [Ischnura elegans]|uniref:tRNA-dihydrouridine(20) synthase [NAD(P)+]-like n=1 Tax=Ischnura elegans TaxID=197161 RepID=UPI001ED89CEB|nr:tRNA-dihydrouridine(20) synthase [NAD(P)+]-like [Ischnura elegans]
MSKIDYRNKIILAPMVRAGTLPLRLLSLDYGADLVYCEELIDWKLIRSTRKVNDALGTVDYVDRTDGTVVFRTCEREKGKVVLQIGTCSPERALEVAKKIQEDVAAIDINMGCPKEFSLKGGMGAALLSKPDLACSIISTLSSNLSIPVTCKIRVLSTVEETLALCKRLEASGAAAIAIHGRRIDERPQHTNRSAEIAQVARALSIPVIANGGSKEIACHDDIERFRVACGAASVMVARAAQKDCTIFRRDVEQVSQVERKGAPVDVGERWKALEPLIKDYLYYCVRYASPAPNVKYCIQAMLKDLQESPLGKKFLEAQTLVQICDIWGMGEFCRSTEEQQSAQREKNSSQPAYVPQVIRTVRGGDVDSGVDGGVEDGKDEIVESREGSELSLKNNRTKKLKTMESGEEGALSDVSKSPVVELHIAFLRSLYKEDRDLPKTQLLVMSRKKHVPQPKYKTEQVDKLFRSEVQFNGQKYTSTYWEKNKRAAEQGAALACLVSIGAVQPSDHALTQRTRF